MAASTRIRITKLRQHDGFFTANVTAEGGDTVRVDNSIGCWTLPVDQHAEPGTRVVRREVLPWVVKLLNDRVRGFLRGDTAPEEPEGGHEIVAGGGFRHINPEKVAARMAKAGADAIGKAA